MGRMSYFFERFFAGIGMVLRFLWDCLALLGLIALVACAMRGCTPTTQETVTEERTVRVDTVRVTQVVAIAERPTGLERVAFPVTAVIIPTPTDSTEADSVAVEIPLTQTEYRDSTYRAWVSGFHARLDSIELYPRTETVTVTVKERPRRWSIGASTGLALTPRGLQPYIGVGVTYNIATF